MQGDHVSVLPAVSPGLRHLPGVAVAIAHGVVTVPVVVRFVANVVRRIVDPAVAVDVEDHPEAARCAWRTAAS
jgi:hypothetical protein